MFHLSTKHFGRPHSWEDCGKEFEWRDEEEVAQSLANAIKANGGSLEGVNEVAKFHGNIVSNRLYKVPLKRFHPAIFPYFERCCRKLCYYDG